MRIFEPEFLDLLSSLAELLISVGVLLLQTVPT